MEVYIQGHRILLDEEDAPALFVSIRSDRNAARHRRPKTTD